MCQWAGEGMGGGLLTLRAQENPRKLSPQMLSAQVLLSESQLLSAWKLSTAIQEYKKIQMH